jgi:hypothetical protein
MAGHLLSLFQPWAPDQPVEHKIIVSIPTTICGFLN